MRGDFPSALSKIEQYKSYAQQLVAADPDNPKWQMELHYAHSNLGAMFYEMQRWEEAERNLLAALEVLNAVNGSDYPIADDSI